MLCEELGFIVHCQPAYGILVNSEFGKLINFDNMKISAVPQCYFPVSFLMWFTVAMSDISQTADL